jgi:hypothetical protein
MDANIQWSERLLSLLGRLANSLILFVNNRPVPDSLLFVFSVNNGPDLLCEPLQRRGDKGYSDR